MSQRDAHDGFKKAAALVADLDRRQAELDRLRRELVARTPAARAAFARALDRARRAGLSFGRLAGVTFAATNGRAPSRAERSREATRLRQAHRRNGVTMRQIGHGDRQGLGGASESHRLGSKVGDSKMMHDDQYPHPVRRVVIEEFDRPLPAPPLGGDPCIDDPHAPPPFGNGCDLPVHDEE